MLRIFKEKDRETEPIGNGPIRAVPPRDGRDIEAVCARFLPRNRPCSVTLTKVVYTQVQSFLFARRSSIQTVLRVSRYAVNVKVSKQRALDNAGCFGRSHLAHQVYKRRVLQTL